MSASIVINSETLSNVEQNHANATTKAKPLPAKLAKFIQYGYFIIKHFAQLDPSIDADKLNQYALSFDDPILQFELVNRFLNSPVANEIKNINDQRKRELKNNAKLAAKLAKAANKPVSNKPSRKGGNNKPAVKDDLVADLVALAKSKHVGENIHMQFENMEEPNQPNNITTADQTMSTDKTNETAKTNAKAKAKAKAKSKSTEDEAKAKSKSTEDEAKAEVPVEVKTETPVELKTKTKTKTKSKPKPKAAAADADAKPKTKNSKAKSKNDDVATELDASNSTTTTAEESELSVSIFKFDDKTFLIDADNNLFDFNTHLPIGTFDATLRKISFLLP